MRGWRRLLGRDRGLGGRLFHRRGDGSSCGRPVIGHDAALDDDISWSADHDQMLDVVAADEHEPAARVDGGG
ncbi:hypothetical protein, partial [Sinorhizobium sp. CCBAU 05631]|uniref:hypothetical protein n=1 Tax=Sinorhizobium sp. CCBAU 05631 TaxID=794846 RepID=UPI0012F9A637